MKLILATVLLASTVTLFAAEAQWPQFRGPNGAGLAEGQKPVVEFGPEKNLLWKATVPPGASSPVIAGDRIFLTGFENKKLFTFCVSRKDGKELWRAEAPAKAIEKFHELEGSPAASSAATDGERVVVYFGSYGLLCYDLDGKELWHAEMPVAETNNDFGTGTSPILENGRVFLARDLAKDSALFCFDVKTGRQLWKTVRDGFFTSYSTPLLWRHDGKEELVVGGALRLKAYDPATGAERWVVRDLPSVDCTTPVAADGMVYFGGWTPGGVDAPMPEFSELLKNDDDKDGHLSKAEAAKTFLKDFFDSNDTNKDGFIKQNEWDAMIGYLRSGKIGVAAVKAGASGDATESHVAWRTDRGVPYVPTPIFYKGRLYMLKDGGMATCVDAKTGKAIYTQTRLGLDGGIYASPVAADGRIYGINLRGVAFVYSAGDKPELLNKADLGERSCATPAIVDNVLYYRTATKLWAFGMKHGHAAN
jgi:outer membrane protein assembly factor BamB